MVLRANKITIRLQGDNGRHYTITWYNSGKLRVYTVTYNQMLIKQGTTTRVPTIDNAFSLVQEALNYPLR